MNQTSEKGYWEYIWEKFKNGDRRAFELIYKEYVDVLFIYGSKLTHHHALVEDALQDTFLAVYTCGGTLRKSESLEFYLYKTLRRIIIKKLKEKYRFTHPDHFNELFELKFPIEDNDSEDLDDRIILLKRELIKLDTKKRELLFLKFNSGLTYDEIGAILDCKSDTVKKQVSRILSLLQAQIKKPFIGFIAFFSKKEGNMF